MDWIRIVVDICVGWLVQVGVEKFAAEANKNMPWRKILEMGEKVFHETRTPADLKDKWRSMVKIMNKNEQGSTLTPTAM